MVSASSLIKIDIISSVLFLLASGSASLAEIGLLAKNHEDKALDVVDKTPAQLIQLRGFIAEEHAVVTEDGFILHLVRIINPLANRSFLKRPILFNHGLLESSTIWLINSKSMKPMRYPQIDFPPDFQIRNASMINAPMLLSNQGYDVWLLSMRGTDFSQGHMNATVDDSVYWDYCLDDFALKDAPATIDYIRLATGAEKVGYVGHSQATFTIFALLSARPEYADIVEPIAAFAPVAFMEHTTSLARPVFKLAADLPIVDKLNIPSPLFCPELRKGLKGACDKSKFIVLKSFCKAEEMLISGMGQNFKQGFFSHLPFYSSLKVFRHFGQLVNSKRFCRYNYGKEGNMIHYNNEKNPDYNIARIRSKSLCLFWTKFDSLATPRDVKSFVSQLTVPVFRSIYTNEKINHMDLLLSDRAHQFNRPLLEIMEHFENGIDFDFERAKLELDRHFMISNDLQDYESEFKSIAWDSPGLSIKVNMS